MTPEQFAYWLQGFVELHGTEPTAEQWQQIKDHLQTVSAKQSQQTSATYQIACRISDDRAFVELCKGKFMNALNFQSGRPGRPSGGI